MLPTNDEQPSLDATRRLALLDALPDLQLAVPTGDRLAARRALVVPAARLPRGALTAAPDAVPGSPFALVLVSGLVLRTTSVAGAAGTEILGDGDVIDVARDAAPGPMSITTEHVVHQAATVAVLDDSFRQAARLWPALHDAIGAQRTRQSRRASAHLAILQLPRVEDRIMAVFSDFSERWGKVTADGVAIDLPLTHALLGQVVGARRPTVSLALAALAEDGLLTRASDGRWLLSHDAAGARAPVAA